MEAALVCAILNRDLHRIGELVDELRFERRLNYCQTSALARKLTGISPADWDDLLYEIDLQASRN